MKVNKSAQPGLSQLLAVEQEYIALPKLRLDVLHLQLSIRRAIKEMTA